MVYTRESFTDPLEERGASTGILTSMPGSGEVKGPETGVGSDEPRQR